MEKPKTLREYIEAELATTTEKLTTARQTKAYQDAADAKSNKDALTTALKHVEYLTGELAQAETKHDFQTCAKVG